MTIQILIGFLMIVFTTIIHAGGMMVGMRLFISTWGRRLGEGSMLSRALLMAGLILILVVATLIEAGIWAGAYSVIGAIPDFEPALYFSMVTYTTLGFGDIVLTDDWRLLSSIEAANGIIMFAWTTALIVVAIHQVSRTLQKFDAVDKK
jgi:hypothetical protein